MELELKYIRGNNNEVAVMTPTLEVPRSKRVLGTKWVQSKS